MGGRTKLIQLVEKSIVRTRAVLGKTKQPELSEALHGAPYLTPKTELEMIEKSERCGLMDNPKARVHHAAYSSAERSWFPAILSGWE